MTSIFNSVPRTQTHRQQFPSLQNKAYFNFGGQGPLPQIALDAIIEAYRYIQEYGPFSVKINAWIQEQEALLREAIAAEIGATVDTISLTQNVTDGCNIALWGIDWQPSDHILMSDCEHPGVIATVTEIGRRFGVTVSTCPILETLNEGNPVAIIEEHLQPQTRLVILSHLLWNTGQVLPLADIVKLCHSHSTQLLIDAAQSVGSLPLNLTAVGVDFYAFTGHKWLCGPAGGGGLYVSEQARETLNPTFIGWRSINLDSQGKPTGWKPDGRRYEVATSAYPQYAGLRNAIALHQQWGTPQERYTQICQLSEYLWQRLSQFDFVCCLRTAPPEAGLVSFQLTNGQSHSTFVRSLEEKGFLLRTLANPDCIRACVHYFTLQTEIDSLIEAIQETPKTR